MTKIYVLVCSYFIDGKVIDIELTKMLDNLQIKPTELYYNGICYGMDNHLDIIVRWNLEKRYKVRYVIKTKKTKNGYSLNSYEGYSSDSLESTEWYLNNLEEKIIRDFSDEEFEDYFKNYGNDYTDQCKGGK